MKNEELVSGEQRVASGEHPCASATQTFKHSNVQAFKHSSFFTLHSSFIQVLFPSTCAACGRVLTVGEEQLCLHCLADIACLGYADFDDNPAERQLAGLPHLVSASAMLAYRKESTVQKVVHSMKFHGNSELCLMMGRQLALDLHRGGRFDDVDLLVPVPLHWLRRLSRGYNQSLLLCRGMAEVLHLPISSGNLVRHRYTHKQSQQRSALRSSNVEGAFSVRHPEKLAGKHLLLVDNVLTTGATLSACADALSTIPNIKLSVATLTMAG
ncbi:MAG: ComF family protein [Bacteroidales bacterium]|nr:ComF family protein [Bacteroidales bacterium]